MPRVGRLVFVLFLLGGILQAEAADRVALVIGNQAYNDRIGPLRNPHNDISLVGKALSDVGFKLLPSRRDSTRDDILFAVHELASQVRSIRRDAVTFLYYSGHGVAVDGENILVPTNAEDTTDAMLSVRGVRLSEILDILKREAPDAVHFIVLDACRSNLRGHRGARGFAPVNDRRTGVVIAFSTAPGETATDDGAKSGPYAAALAEELIRPGSDDQAVFNAVRARVVRAARGQTPWTHDGLIGERVVFKAAAGQSAAPAIATQSLPQPRASEAAEAWNATKDTSSPGVLEAFAGRYPNTIYADLARARIDELKKQQVALARPPPAAAKGPPAAGAGSPPPAAQPADKTFSLSGGKTVDLMNGKLSFSMIGTPYGARRDLVGVRANGATASLAVGQFVQIKTSDRPCGIYLLEIRGKENEADFSLTCGASVADVPANKVRVSVNLSAAAPAVENFTLSGGKSRQFQPGGVLIAFISTPYGARRDLVGVRVQGQAKPMAVGQRIDVTAGSQTCTLMLREIHAGTNSADFSWQC